MKLIEQWYKKWSVWLLIATASIAWGEQLLPSLQAALPADWYKWAVLAITVARLIQQGEKIKAQKDAANS